MPSHALGLIETKGLIAAIEAADAASKAAAVVISSAELTDAAYMTIKIEGELGAVQAAVAAGAHAAQSIGELVAVHVIPRPDEGLGTITPPQRYVSKYHEKDNRSRIRPVERQSIEPRRAQAPQASSTPTRTVETVPSARPSPKPQTSGTHDLATLQAMPVVKLRQYARNIPNLGIQGRQISIANKEELLAAIRKVMGLD